jgi:hypothetical protein
MTSQIFSRLLLLLRANSLNNSLMQWSNAAMHKRSTWSRLFALPWGLALLVLAACNGTAVVTLTATPSTDTYLAYRVGLNSVQFHTSNGRTDLKALPSGTTLDFAGLVNLSEVIGVMSAKKGTYTSATITLDYSAAQIVYDDGSLDGVSLTPVDSSGQALSQVTLTINLDPSQPFRITAKQAALLALNFNLAASNVVNLSAKTVTVTPLMAASSLPIDSKQVIVRGPLSGVDVGDLSFTSGVMPFGSNVSGSGTLSIVTSDVTTYEVNGVASTGTAGLTQVGALSSGSRMISYGTLTSNTITTDTGTETTTPVDSNTDTTTTTATATDTSTDETSTTSSTSVVFSAAQVLGGSSVQGSGLDRISGVVSARSGNTLTLEDATLFANDGTNSFIPETTVVTIGANTLITLFGQGTSADSNTAQQISVGSSIDAFGIAVTNSAGTATLDATAGRVRLDTSTASGLVSVQGVGVLTLDLMYLGGRSVSAFDFSGSGATATQYAVNTGDLDLTYSIAGAPVLVSGLTGAFGTASPNFTATTLLDSTTIQAELVVDYGAGTPAPFASFDTTGISLDALNSSIGLRHQIQLGSQVINVVGLSSNPLITPNTASSAMVFVIGHSVTGTNETFNTYADFITQLQTELNGTTLATGITAIGQYTVTTFSFAATSITLFLND